MLKKVKFSLQPPEDITKILIGDDCATKEQGVHSLDPTTNAIE